MGHRALVAVERSNGRYDLHRSRWGADQLRLLRRLDPDAPLERDLVDPEPLCSGATAATTLDLLDPVEYEALFAVDRAGVTAYQVIALSPALATVPDDRRASPSALVPVDDAATAARLRRFCRATKAVLGDAVDAGLLTEGMAIGYLRARLAAHPDVRTDEVIWLPGGDR